MRRSFSNHLMKFAVQTLGALPGAIQNRIGGGRLDISGHRLCPEISMFLRLMGDIEAASPENHPITQVRSQTDADAWTFGGPEIALHSVSNLFIPNQAEDIPARHYQGTPTSSGLLIYFHGGAWVSGGLNSCDSICRFIARHADMHVLSVDYRLAPEHVYPAALDDALSAYRFALSLPGSEACFVAVGGDSAGGNIAASLCRQLTTSNLPMPHFQLLFYPVMDVLNKAESYHLFSSGYVLSEAQMDWAKALYAPQGNYADPALSPLLAASLQGLPPAYVATAEFDVLRDEGERYAARLKACAPATQLRRAPGLIHGFANMMGASRTARAEMRLAVEALLTAQANWQMPEGAGA
jgi:acetyl esterase